jgi:carboxyl-terminal processing protease
MPQRRRRTAAALLLLVAVLGLIPARHPVPLAPAAAHAAAQSDPRLATVETAYTFIMDYFYRVPDPPALLTAAWDGAAAAISRAGFAGRLPRAPDLPPDRAGAWRAFAAAYPALTDLAPPGLSARNLAFAAVEAMAESLFERHTAFYTPEQYRAVTGELGGDGTAVGLGIEITDRAPWIVTAVAPGGPAERAGVRPGDTIRAVDGRDVTGVGRATLNRAVAGAAGADVRLALERPGEGRLTLAVTRGPYRFPDLEAHVLEGGVGYVRLRTFSTFLSLQGGPANVIQELDAALARFEAAGASVWVLDLRHNSGGFVFTANEIVGHFLPDAVTYRALTERGNRGEQLGSGRPFPVQRPMAVLIDGGSASASELVAAALQEYGRAVVVGERSSGAFAGAQFFPLEGGAALYLAVMELRTGRQGAVVDDVGVTPDREVADTRTAEDYAAGRDPQLDAAVEAVRAAGPPSVAPSPFPAAMSEEALRALLAPYLPTAGEAPPAPLIDSPRLLGDVTLTDPSQFVNLAGPVVDARELARVVRERGWLGSTTRYFGGEAGLNGPILGVTIDLYRTPAGAYDALVTNDAPQLQRMVMAPLQLGDGAVAYTGAWINAGLSALVWRSGRAVITVAYGAVPGQETFGPVTALANVVDARLRARPLPPLEAPTAP